MPAALGRVLPKRGTPWVAILVTTIVAMVITFTGGLAVLVLRRDRVEHEHFRVWTVIPVLGALSCLALMTQQGWDVWLRAGILIAIGAVLFLASKWWGGRAARRTQQG